MSTVAIAITYADSGPIFPAGTVVDHLVLTVTDPTGKTATQSVAESAPSVSLSLTASGSYTASLQAVDVSGAALGAAVSTTFTIAAAAEVSLSLPSALTASVS